jgi:metal-responsive CopG/Arc/MetJ family transcriptional regulator
MKIKTSITISDALIKQLDNYLGSSGNRSALIEQALREFLATKAQQVREAKDLDILNNRAKALDEEANDVLTYQVEL